MTCRRRRGSECRAPHPRRSPPLSPLLSSPRSAPGSRGTTRVWLAGAGRRRWQLWPLVRVCVVDTLCARSRSALTPIPVSRAGRGRDRELGGPRDILRSGERSQRQPCGTRDSGSSAGGAPRPPLCVWRRLPYLTLAYPRPSRQSRSSSVLAARKPKYRSYYSPARDLPRDARAESAASALGSGVCVPERYQYHLESALVTNGIAALRL